MRTIYLSKVLMALTALFSYASGEAQTWTTPTPLAPTGSSGPEPYSYYSMAANPAIATVLNTGVTNVNGFSFAPALGWNTPTAGWVENDALFPTSQFWNKTAVLPAILDTPAFGIGVMQASAGGIYGFVFKNGGWAAGQQITTDASAQFPAIALNGNVYNTAVLQPYGIAVWNSSNENQPISYSLYTQAPFLPAAVWTESAVIPRSVGIYPNVACDVMGNSVTVWVNTVDGTLDAASYALDNTPNYGIWSQITSLGTSDGGYPRVKMDAAGNAYALWTDVDSNVVAAYLPVHGEWTNVTTLNSTGPNNSPSLSVDPVRNAVVVWQDSYNNFIYASFLPASEGLWQPAVEIGSGMNPEVSIDTIGNAIAVWSDTSIRSALLPFNGSWTAPAQISASGLGSVFPKVGSSGDSAAVVVWEQGSNGFLMASSGTDLFPPVAPYGIKVQLKHKKHDRYVTFKPSWDTSIVNYNMYRNETLIATFPFGGPYFFNDTNGQSPSDIYSVEAVNSSGVTSTPIQATVPVK